LFNSKKEKEKKKKTKQNQFFFVCGGVNCFFTPAPRQCASCVLSNGKNRKHTQKPEPKPKAKRGPSGARGCDLFIFQEVAAIAGAPGGVVGCADANAGRGVNREIKKECRVSTFLSPQQGMRLRLFCPFAKARPRGRGSAAGVLYQLLLRL
jgi:hypothetical protein